ncbi:MAG: GHMP kinase [Bacteroidetes bacterium]|nr:GHMP kinase [Bacteroidota bacterium]
MKFSSPGKLLLTGEYAVLHGATALSLPTRFGQHLVVEECAQNIRWTALDEKGEKWFEAEFSINLEVLKTSDTKISDRLKSMLQFIFNHKPELKKPLSFQTQLDFNRSWGLGSSSTLIANLAKWSGVNWFDLMRSVFNGSGYDVATGMEDSAILYSLENQIPVQHKTQFEPPYRDQIKFVYLGKKQDTQEDLSTLTKTQFSAIQIQRISEITRSVLKTKSLDEFILLMQEHENIISQFLNRDTIHKSAFPEFPGLTKSLGAWGGDFVLVCGYNHMDSWFAERGYSTILTWEEMIKP